MLDKPHGANLYQEGCALFLKPCLRGRPWACVRGWEAPGGTLPTEVLRGRHPCLPAPLSLLRPLFILAVALRAAWHAGGPAPGGAWNPGAARRPAVVLLLGLEIAGCQLVRL